MFKRLKADADLSQEHELRGMVAKILSNLETFGNVSGQHSFSALAKVSGRSFTGTGSHFDFQRENSSSKISGLRRSSEYISIASCMLAQEEADVICTGSNACSDAAVLLCEVNLELISLISWSRKGIAMVFLKKSSADVNSGLARCC